MCYLPPHHSKYSKVKFFDQVEVSRKQLRRVHIFAAGWRNYEFDMRPAIKERCKSYHHHHPKLHCRISVCHIHGEGALAGYSVSLATAIHVKWKQQPYGNQREMGDGCGVVTSGIRVEGPRRWTVQCRPQQSFRRNSVSHRKSDW